MNYIDLSIGEGVSFKKEQEDIIYDIVNKVCDEEKLPFDIYLSVIVVSKEEISSGTEELTQRT